MSHEIFSFAERYQNLGKLKYAYAIPNPNGTTENDRWQHISQALFSAVATGCFWGCIAVGSHAAEIINLVFGGDRHRTVSPRDLEALGRTSERNRSSGPDVAPAFEGPAFV